MYDDLEFGVKIFSVCLCKGIHVFTCSRGGGEGRLGARERYIHVCLSAVVCVNLFPLRPVAVTRG